ANTDTGRGIALDAAGSTYLTGDTVSTDFPTTPGAFDTSLNGNGDAFVTKLVAIGVPASTPGCEVDIADNGRITALNGDKALFHGHAKVQPSGVSGTQRYDDQGPVQPLTVESTNVLAVVCSADRTE